MPIYSCRNKMLAMSLWSVVALSFYLRDAQTFDFSSFDHGSILITSPLRNNTFATVGIKKSIRHHFAVMNETTSNSLRVLAMAWLWVKRRPSAMPFL
ncbi:MAG: hypothetical protein OEU26_13230 [Candidatus Tectomicrobia bacterium]|nr:hypothetical protein [Candidatus Tectomicrobia bacterium]